MTGKLRFSWLLLTVLTMLAFLSGGGASLAAPGPTLSRHVAISGPVELTLSITPAVAEPRDEVVVNVTLVNRQTEAAGPEVLLLLPAGLAPRGGRLPAGTTYNYQDNSLAWMPVLAAGGSASVQLNFVASTADLRQPMQVVEARLRYGDQEQVASVDFWTGLPPTVSIGASPAVVSVGEPVQLTALTTGPGPFVQTWELGDGREVSASNPAVAYSSPGTYAVTARVSNPLAVASASTQVTVIAEPIAAFTVDDSLPTVEQVVTFVNHSGGQQPLQFRWDFGDGATSSEANPEHQYAAPGIYTVRLSVESEYGRAETSQPVSVGAGPIVDFVVAESGVTGQAIYGQAYTDDSVTRLVWDMGDSRQYEGDVVEHTYHAVGDYLVTLRAENEFGTSEVTHWVHVESGTFLTLLPLIVSQPLAVTTTVAAGDGNGLVAPPFDPIQLQPPVIAQVQPLPQPDVAAPLPAAPEPVVEAPAEPPVAAPVASGGAGAPLESITVQTPAIAPDLSSQPPLSPDATPAEQLLWYINEARRLHGLAPLTYSYELSVAAQMHTEDLVGNPDIMHDGSDGSMPPERQRRYGYQGIYGGEAVAWGFDNAVPVVEFWVNSPPHRILILNPDAREVGVGYYADSRAPNIWYWTAEIGIVLGPAPETPAPSPN